jgi:hypothetical protein
MARFSNLLDEILLLLPLPVGDLLSTVLVNRGLHGVHSMLLYKKVKLDGEQPAGTDRLVCFLLTIIAVPRLAASVHKLILENWTHRLDPPNGLINNPIC